MQRYSKNRVCPKCGGYATSKYDSPAANGLGHVSLKYALKPLIRRRCINCGYGWSEEPLDASSD